MKKTYFLNTFLAVVLTAALGVLTVLRAVNPVLVLPGFGIPNLVLVSLAALLLDHYLVPGAERCYICIPVFSAIAFGLLPWAAGFAFGMEALLLAVKGCVVFTAVTWLFSSMMDRLSTGPAAKAAPVFSAFGLYLASQCLMGMF